MALGTSKGIQELEGLFCTRLMHCTLAEGPAPEDTSRGVSWIRSLLDLQRWVLAQSHKSLKWYEVVDTADCKLIRSCHFATIADKARRQHRMCLVISHLTHTRVESSLDAC